MMMICAIISSRGTEKRVRNVNAVAEMSRAVHTVAEMSRTVNTVAEMSRAVTGSRTDRCHPPVIYGVRTA